MTHIPHRGGWPDSAPPWLKTATDYIDRNAHTDIRLADVASVAHVTPRALQLAFRRRLATTPRGYLLDARLEGAHRDLVSTDPSITTVAAVAQRWGFRHPGRFARRYQQKFGCYPEATLKGVGRRGRKLPRRAG